MSRERIAVGSLLVALCLGSAGCALLVAGAVGGGATGAAASAGQADEEHSVGAYAGAVAADILYVPAKIVFAGLGAVTAGITYLVTVGNQDASSAVWNSAVNGTYVITPRHIEGKEPIRFIGP